MASLRENFLLNSLDLLACARGENDAAPGLSQRNGNGLANSAPRAGHDGNFSFETAQSPNPLLPKIAHG